MSQQLEILRGQIESDVQTIDSLDAELRRLEKKRAEIERQKEMVRIAIQSKKALAHVIENRTLAMRAVSERRARFPAIPDIRPPRFFGLEDGER